jgi:uncharacterized protein DUF4476
MSKIGLVAILVLMSVGSFAQQDYFVFIQADNNQPFYARIGEGTYSSSARGSLILSKLQDSTYMVTIGFPKKQFPEQQFPISINNKDLDLELKDLGEKGWGLFNSQTQELKMAVKKEEPNSHPGGTKKDDAFSLLMAGVVGDTAVMYDTYAKAGTLKDSPVAVVSSISGNVDTQKVAAPADKGSATMAFDSSKVAVTAPSPAPANPDTLKSTLLIAAAPSPGKADSPNLGRTDSSFPGRTDSSFPGKADSLNSGRIDSPNLGKTDSSKQFPAADPVASIGKGEFFKPVDSIPLYRVNTVRKLSERRTAKAMRLVYADHIEGRKSDTIVVIIPVDTALQIIQNQPDSLKSGVNLNTVAAAVTKPDSIQKKGRPRPVLVNSDCKNFASDYDVDKLRVKMLEVGKDDDRILVAKKAFLAKCFTTRQIKALSEVFASDALKFKFFETAYPFVSDDHFRELADLLADPVYSSKFKVMTSPK